jgi:hypothetical protein
MIVWESGSVGVDVGIGVGFVFMVRYWRCERVRAYRGRPMGRPILRAGLEYRAATGRSTASGISPGGPS